MGSILLLILLLVLSGLISGSEVAFFSLTPNHYHKLEKEEDRHSRRILSLMEKPKDLLATILISNNLVNIAIVILSDYLLKNLIPETVFIEMGHSLQQVIGGNPALLSELISFVITVIGVTFLLVLFGEVAPKIYANINNLGFRVVAHSI